MMITISTNSRQPIYEQLISKITELVMFSVLEPGEQLPSVRALAGDLGINPNTVQKAYSALENSGIIHTITGKGSFIADKPPKTEANRWVGELKRAVVSCVAFGMTLDSIMEIVKATFNEGVNGI